MSALTGLRIVELAETVAGEYCGKLLADFGADVVKVERSGRGSPTRSLGPVVDGESLVFAYLNTNKRSVVADPATRDALIASADAVIEDRDPGWAAEAHRRHPGVVFCSVSPFGAGSSEARRNARSLNVFHSSGWGYHTPSRADPTLPPLPGPGRYLADYEAGLDAALCVAACLIAQTRSGAGEHIDVSQQAALVSRADCILGRFVTGEVAPQNTRDDFDQQGPASFFGCVDGHVYLYVTSAAHWAGLKELMGRPGWLDDFDDDWLEFSVTPQKVAAFHRGFAAWIATQTRDAVADRAQRHGVPLVPVHRVGELHRSPQYRHRGFFADVDDPVRGTRRHSTVPYRFSASPAQITSRAPVLGQHTATVSPGSVRAAPAGPAPAGARGGPLAGVRVVELTKVWAGPYAGKLLAFLGAEVIKVECASRPEEMRAYGGTDIDHAPYFLSINPEILSVDKDIKTSEGRRRLRELVAHSDIVLDNLRPGAMARQGLGYEELRTVKPDIISVSIKMWGNDGPLGHQTGYAPCFAALAGMASVVGRPGGPPLGASMRYGDSTVGAAAAFAAVVALRHRDRTGEGQFVDVSAVEVLSSMIGDVLLEESVTGREPDPDGSGHPDLSPHGCYPCAGADDWVSIAVGADDEWRALCRALGAAELSADARYADRAARRRHRSALDEDLALLTRRHEVGSLVGLLLDAGVPVAKSATVLDVLGDDGLWERGAFCFVTDHREGRRPVVGPSWRMTRDPARIERGAPMLGEHNDYVFGEILGAERRST